MVGKCHCDVIGVSIFEELEASIDARLPSTIAMVPTTNTKVIASRVAPSLFMFKVKLTCARGAAHTDKQNYMRQVHTAES